MSPPYDETQDMQNKVDRLKLMNLTNNIHSLLPPSNKNNSQENNVAFVEALNVTPRLKRLFLEIRGLEWDEHKKEYIQVTRAIMNFEGAYRFVKICQHIAEETEWSSFAEEEIPKRIIHYYEENIPYFLFWNDEYELAERDFNYIMTTLKSFIDSSFHKAKAGKFINSLSRIYDEGTIRKALETPESRSNKKEEGFLARYNPFR